MRMTALLWSGLLAFAPAMAACACPPERRACERQERGCCGEKKAPAPCPRSQPVVDTLDQPALGLELPSTAPELVLATPALEAVEAVSTSSRASDDGPPRASPSRPLFLRISVLLL